MTGIMRVDVATFQEIGTPLEILVSGFRRCAPPFPPFSNLTCLFWIGQPPSSSDPLSDIHSQHLPCWQNYSYLIGQPAVWNRKVYFGVVSLRGRSG